jgi:hypothetical protein
MTARIAHLHPDAPCGRDEPVPTWWKVSVSVDVPDSSIAVPVPQRATFLRTGLQTAPGRASCQDGFPKGASVFRLGAVRFTPFPGLFDAGQKGRDGRGRQPQQGESL